jgi:hypothetical protein
VTSDDEHQTHPYHQLPALCSLPGQSTGAACTEACSTRYELLTCIAASLDHTTGDTVPEPVGRWVEGRVVFTPPTTELEFYSALATYLQV